MRPNRSAGSATHANLGPRGQDACRPCLARAQLGSKIASSLPRPGPRPRFPFRSCFELKRVAVSELASRCDMRGHGRVVAWGPGSMGRRQAGSNILPGS